MNTSIKEAVQIAIDGEKNLPANCLTIGRFGVPKEGITLSLDRGPDQYRPWEPHVSLDGYRIHRDRKDGAVYVKDQSGKTGLVRRAVGHMVELEGKKVFYTLMRPEVEKPGTSLVHVCTNIPFSKGVVINDHEIRLYTGVVGGNLIGKSRSHALVELMEGQSMTVFYEDGAVRKFRRQGKVLDEYPLTADEMLDLRIEQAWNDLEWASSIEDVERQARVMFAILSGMADMLHLTARFDGRGLGQGMRMKLIRNFFLELSPECMEFCHRKVTAILHQVDSALLSLLYTGSSFEKTELPEGVVDIQVARNGRDRVQREAERAARRAERIAAQPKKTARGGESKGGKKGGKK